MRQLFKYFRCISVRVRVQFYFERAHYLFIYLIDVYNRAIYTRKNKTRTFRINGTFRLNFTLRYFPHLYIVRDCAHMVGGSS